MSAGRVIAGTARGIRLTGPAAGVRPFGDRLKEGLFAILEPRLRGARVLDLFAGTGAAGIEALSRGAAAATFVDNAAAAIGAIERNLRATHLDGPAATVVRAEAIAWLREASANPYDVVLVDPPYDRPELLTAALDALGGAGGARAARRLLAADGLLVTKHPRRVELPARIGLLASTRERRVGESTLTFFGWSDGEGR